MTDMNNWEFHFDAPPGARCLSRGVSITVMGGTPSLWWDLDNRRWLTDEEVPWGRNNPARTFPVSTHAPCRTFKAFKRHLRRHAGKLAGREVVFVNRFSGNDIVALPRNKNGGGLT